MHRIKYILPVIVAAVCGVLLFFFDPEETVWLPKCPFHLLTGLECPSCGFQRAVYSLLHLRFADAFRYNPFLFIAAPYAIALVAVTWFDPHGRLGRLRKLCYSKITVYIYLALFVLWGIVRNII